MARVFIMQVASSFCGDGEGPRDRRVKILFLREVKAAGLGVKSRFDIMGFSISDVIWGL